MCRVPNAHLGVRRAPVMLAVIATLGMAAASYAGPTAGEQCKAGRYKAAAQYSACEQKVLAKLYGGSAALFEERALKCRDKYRATWAKLQAKASGTGSPCDTPRFTDNGDGTVTDHLTVLQWEKKTNDATVHDKDNSYSWTDAGDASLTDADGTAYTSFLATLNGGGCFAEQCDWRLPTLLELQTILPHPCGSSPCIDAIFGPMAASFHWSSTTSSDDPEVAWAVVFDNTIEGGWLSAYVGKDYSLQVRAVRGGL